MNDKHVLIIDDNPGNVKVLTRFLTLEGIRVTSIQDPNMLEGVLEDEAEIDLIFLDLEMPHSNGYEVLDLLKTNPSLGNTPIIAHTVHTEHLPTARELGFHSFIPKPLNADLFPDQLARVMRGEPVWSTN